MPIPVILIAIAVRERDGVFAPRMFHRKVDVNSKEILSGRFGVSMLYTVVTNEGLVWVNSDFSQFQPLSETFFHIVQVKHEIL